MEYSDDDVKKYAPKKGAANKTEPVPEGLKDDVYPSDDLPKEKKELRKRQDDYLFRGYGSMMDTSEMIDFSEGADSD